MPSLTFREVDESSWTDFELLFESRGGPKACWCMAWRAIGPETRQKSGAERKCAIERRVRTHVPIGILGYMDDQPVAWCSIAPRTSYRALGGLEPPGEAPETVWSLVCFFIRRELRGKGVTVQLLAAAIAHARKNGARVIEAYPVAPDSPSYRFMGFVPTFEAAGFQRVGAAGSRRHVMRLRLDRDRR
jgi:GNAT superfamily N-acetyltransferase